MTLMTLFGLALYLSCIQPTDKSDKPLETLTQNSLTTAETKTTNSTGQLFTDFNFSIDCPCQLQKEPNYINTSSTFYKCADLDKKTFYRISIDNQSDALIKLKLLEFNETFVNNFLNEYKNNLTREKAEYKETIFNGQKAIIYTQNITVDATVIRNKAIIFLAHKNSYTLSIMSNPQEVDKYFDSYINSFKWLTLPKTSTNIQIQTQLEIYTSPKYGYTINIPENFKKVSATGKNIDLKIINDIGNSILVNVTPRQPDEYSITAHDYTVEMLENSIKPYNPYFNIVKDEKIYIDGEKAFLIYHTNSNTNLKAIECYIYYKDKAYVLTATSKINTFSSYEKTFLTMIKSIKFKK